MRVLSSRFFTFFAIVTMLSACGHSAPAGSAGSGDLRSIVEEKIRDNVRESYGEFAGQCFTDADLDIFTRNKVPDRIVEQLKSDSRFNAAVAKVRAMPADERAAYLKRSRLPLHKTWAELGAVSSAGQTDAGQRAETMTSNAIVDLAESLLAGPPTPAKK
jgi:hypothetical protein